MINSRLTKIAKKLKRDHIMTSEIWDIWVDQLIQDTENILWKLERYKFYE